MLKFDTTACLSSFRLGWDHSEGRSSRAGPEPFAWRVRPSGAVRFPAAELAPIGQLIQICFLALLDACKQWNARLPRATHR
jgi:hypothetical protein